MMKPFAMKVLNDALQQVRSSEDARELADLLLCYAFCSRQNPFALDQILEEKLLALLINHEIQTAANPDFTNILFLLEAQDVPATLKKRPDWIKYVKRHDQDVRNHVFLSLNNALLPFEPAA